MALQRRRFQARAGGKARESAFRGIMVAAKQHRTPEPMLRIMASEVNTKK